MIKPTGADIGRDVILRLFNEPPLVGKLVEMRSTVDPKTRELQPVAMVKFPDLGMPVATDCEKLAWHTAP